MIKVRFAKKTDKKRILELYNSSQDMWYGSSKDSGYNEKEILEYITDKKNRMFVFEEDKKVLGVLLAEFHSDYVYLHTIIVDKNSRKKGIGKILLDNLDKLAKKEGKKVIETVTSKQNQAMQNLFSKLNYRRAKEFVAYQKFL